MFTQLENAKAQLEQRPFIQLCAEYRTFLAAQELPLTVDLDVIVSTLRQRLFAQLLAVDKGLSLRWELLRSEEAQEKLIAETINLDGYEVIGQIQARINKLQGIYKNMMLASANFFVIPDRVGPSLGELCHVYDLDLVRWLDASTFKWIGSEQQALLYFQDLARRLSKVRHILRQTRNTGASLDITLSLLGRYFTPESQMEEIIPDEHVLYQQLLPELKRLGLLDKLTAA